MNFPQQVKALCRVLEKEINLESKIDDLAQERWDKFNQLGDRAQQGTKGQELQCQAETLEEAVQKVVELIEHLESVLAS